MRPRIERIEQKIKRHIYVYLFPAQANKQLDLRQGECLRCGRCCRLVFRCPMLIGENSPFKCRIYNHRSKLCRQFPMSAEDLRDVDYKCGYRF